MDCDAGETGEEDEERKSEEEESDPNKLFDMT